MNENKKEVTIKDGFAPFYFINWKFYLFVFLIFIFSMFIINYPEKYNNKNLQNLGHWLLSIFFILWPFTGFWKMIAWGILETKSKKGGLKELFNEKQKDYLAPIIAMFFESLIFMSGIMLFIGMIFATFF